MDENKVEVSGATEQEAPDTGVETATEQAAETVQTETEPTAGASEPATEQKNDTKTEHEAAGEEPEKGQPAAEIDAGKLADSAAAAPPAPDVAVVSEQLETAKRQLLLARAESAAAQAGIRPDRIKQAVKLAELSGIDPMANDAENQIAEHIRAVCDGMPELLTATGTGAAGAFARKTEAASDPFERGFGKV